MLVWSREGLPPWPDGECRAGRDVVCAGQFLAGAQAIAALGGRELIFCWFCGNGFKSALICIKFLAFCLNLIFVCQVNIL